MLRTHLVTAACLLAAGPALAAPGQTCAEAIDVAVLPFSHASTTCGAADDFSNDTGAAAVCPDLPRPYGGEDTFYKVSLGPGNRLAFDLTVGATGDLALFLVRQPTCADPPVCAATSVDLIGAGVGPERIKQQSFPPGTYYLIVDSALAPPAPAQCGGYTLSVTGHLSEFCGNGMVEAGEVCDDGNNLDGDCCAADCTGKAAAGTSCRPTAGLCDVAEVCDGNGNCPADQFAAATVCRPAAGICDVPEVCTGTGPLCPADLVRSPGTLCRGSAGPCDPVEFCTGGSTACPADVFAPVGTMCGPSTACLQTARCAGGSACPPGPPVNCDDGNSCTQDSCHAVAGCLHQPICAADAGADASPDATADLLPADGAATDVAADAPTPSDVISLVDAPGIEAAADASSAPDSRSEGLVPVDARAPDAAPPGDARAPDAGAPSDGPDGGATQPAGMMDDAGMAVLADGGLRPDAVAAPGDGASTDGNLPLKKLASDGCSCRLDSSSSRQEGGWWWLAGLALVARIARRRRTTR